ncbi:MAG: DUF3795 domain-containing protein [Mesotoga sp.]|nr:DUF3795 domain-containing protein [Mesotoga sp.]
MNIIAFCGIDCTQCDTYRATLANDDSMRRETASRWSKDFGFDLSFMDINCSGCHGDVHFRLCDGCPFKICCEKRAISNCGECDRYPCETLDRFLKTLPGARSRLDKVHREHFKNSEEQVRYEGFAGTAIILFLENIFLLV